jgi:hypothetical protein
MGGAEAAIRYDSFFFLGLTKRLGDPSLALGMT